MVLIHGIELVKAFFRNVGPYW